jgi:disulfide bond formation protein DsbB
MSAAMRLPPLRSAALIVALAAAAALAAAEIVEHWGGLVPCALCLLERWPWRAAVFLGLLAALLPGRAPRWPLLLAVLVLLAGAGLALTHVGVEQGWWPDPLPECAAPHFAAGSLAQRLAAMPLRPAKPCDAPTYLIAGLPLSMAAMDLIYALLVAAGLAMYLTWTRKETR